MMTSIRAYLLALACCIYSIAALGQMEDEYMIPDQLIVHLQGGVSGPEFWSHYKGVKPECLSKSMNIWLVNNQGSVAKNLLVELYGHKEVKTAQYNHRISRRSLVPNDTHFDKQWNMLNPDTVRKQDIHATEAWGLNHSNVTVTGDTIVLAIIEEPMDIYHEDLNFFVNKNEIPYNGIDDDGNGYIDDYHGWNVFMHNDSVYGSAYHGTHVCGIAAGIGNNGKGIAGVCWGAKILAIAGSSQVESEVIQAYDYALEMRKLYTLTGGAKGAFVVATNASFGVGAFGAHPVDYPIWCAMYDTLGHYGILSAVAGPNANVNVDIVDDIPSGCPSKWMIAVTNTSSTDRLNAAAAYGPNTIDLSAPGTNVYSSVWGNNYDSLTGTSMSTPHVTGTIGALFANACTSMMNDYFTKPDTIALVMKDMILHSVDVIPDMNHKCKSNGRLNLYNAMELENAYNCNNCQYSASLSTNPIPCGVENSGTINSTVSGVGSPYRYVWSTGDTGTSVGHLTAGVYEVTVTDKSGCQRTLSAIVRKTNEIVVTDVHVVSINQGSSGNIIISANAGNDTLQYALDNGPWQSSAIFVVNNPGYYQIHIKSQAGCTTDVGAGVYYTGIHEASETIHMTLSPNPASEVCYVGISAENAGESEVRVSDMSGRILISENVSVQSGTTKKEVRTDGLSTGLYLVSLLRSGQIAQTMRMTVVH